MWFRTVAVLMHSTSAICRVVWPAARCRSTSFSRSLKGSAGEMCTGSDCDEAGGRVELMAPLFHRGRHDRVELVHEPAHFSQGGDVPEQVCAEEAVSLAGRYRKRTHVDPDAAAGFGPGPHVEMADWAAPSQLGADRAGRRAQRLAGWRHPAEDFMARAPDDVPRVEPQQPLGGSIPIDDRAALIDHHRRIGRSFQHGYELLHRQTSPFTFNQQG